MSSSRRSARGRCSTAAARRTPNPWIRLLRREVEGFVRTRYDDRYLRKRQATAELARVDRELNRLRALARQHWQLAHQAKTAKHLTARNATAQISRTRTVDRRCVLKGE